MHRSTSPKRPWLAALLGALVTGLGHLYLRRWRRALGWVLVLASVAALFVEPAVPTAPSGWSAADLLSLSPLVLLGGCSVADAYLLAHAHNAVYRLSVTPDGELTHCPNCRRELDPDLEFCHWCTTEFEAVEVPTPEDGDEPRDP